MARRRKNHEPESPALATSVAVVDAPDIAPPATLVEERAVIEPSPARADVARRGTAAARCSEWDRVQHVYDWFAVYLWIGCMILVSLLNVADTVKMFLGR